jgi:2-oxoacid:acceptor oxidoreductase delta subunit (pyruvate/2-ketoisovalerate family)
MSSVPKTRKEMPLTPISYPTVGSMGKTGSWRTFRPEVDYSKCTKCTLCWVYCPDAAIMRQEDDSPKIDYNYCKGCGVCANECPVKAITMHREEE